MKVTALALLYFLGLGVGWLVIPVPSTPAGQVVRADTLKRERPLDVRERKFTAADRMRIEELLRARNHSNAGADITTGDYPRLMEAFRQRAGASGLPSDEKKTFGSLLRGWYLKDPAAAAEWVGNLTLDRDRWDLGEVLVAAAASQDYDEAVRLAKRFRTNADGVVEVPRQLMMKAAELGAGRLIELVALSAGNGSATGYSLRYPDAFDFTGALDGLAGLCSRGIQPSTYPANMLGEWAKREPDGAIKWASTHGGLERWVDLRSYFEGLKSPEDYLGALTRIAVSGNHSTNLYRSMMYAADSPGSEQTITHLKAALPLLPPEVDGAELRSGLLSGTNHQGGESAPIRIALLAGLTPGQRITTLNRLFDGGGASGWNEESLSSLGETLGQLGCSPDEVEALIPGMAKPPPPMDSDQHPDTKNK